MKKDILNKNIIVFIIMQFSFCFSNCSENQNFDSVINMHQLEYRDSLAIIKVVRTWQDSNFSYFSHKTKPPYNVPDGKVDVIVLKAFYSPNKKKILSWFTEKIPNNDDFRTDSGYYYFSNCMIGVREDTNKIFKFMMFQEQMCEAAELSYIMECMSEYFFKKMKNDLTRLYARYYNPYYGGKLDDEKYLDTDLSIFQEFGYNLQDKDFWERSLMWYKGSRIKGYENEEVIIWASPLKIATDSNRVFKHYPIINYPDSILKLYPGSYKDKNK